MRTSAGGLHRYGCEPNARSTCRKVRLAQGLHSQKRSFRMTEDSSLDAELFAGIGAEALRGPGGSPDNVNCGVADARQLFESRFHLSANVDMLGAALRGEGHIHRDVLLVLLR